MSTAPVSRWFAACRQYPVAFWSTATVLATIVAGLCLDAQFHQQPHTAYALTQTPARAQPSASAYGLDAQYPSGTRVVLVPELNATTKPLVLSKGLLAAGSPLISPSGRYVYFTGKATHDAEWQIYRVASDGGHLLKLTSMPGGASGPALLPDGDLVFSSPAGHSSSTRPAALYRQSAKHPPARITFGISSALDPTVLQDGRILFVSQPDTVRSAAANATAKPALATINNDGTEYSVFAVGDDRALFLRRPRELPNGRIGFLSSADGKTWTAESVRMARPFLSRAALSNVLALEDVPAGAVAPLAVAADWTTTEAVQFPRFGEPMGHLSTIDESRPTGTLLCLDASFTREPGRQKPHTMRISALVNGSSQVVGNVAVHSDGSFMIQAPADTPLGFESLDENGRILHHVAPSIWVRPGENRTCIGCHEPPNRSPRNARPIAANFPPTPLHTDTPILTIATATEHPAHRATEPRFR